MASAPERGGNRAAEGQRDTKDSALLATEIIVAPNLERYGIFRALPDGSYEWVEAEDHLERAMQKMIELASKDRMEYFVYDFRTGARIPLPPSGGHAR